MKIFHKRENFHCNFENCDLRDSDFSDVKLETANFNSADIRRLVTNENHSKYENLMK